MSTDELDRLVAELKSMPTPPWHDFALMRALSAEPDPRMIMPEGVAVEPVDDNGIKGEWLVPEGAGDGVLFYAHGGGIASVRRRPIGT